MFTYVIIVVLSKSHSNTKYVSSSWFSVMYSKHSTTVYTFIYALSSVRKGLMWIGVRVSKDQAHKGNLNDNYALRIAMAFQAIFF